MNRLSVLPLFAALACTPSSPTDVAFEPAAEPNTNESTGEDGDPLEHATPDVAPDPAGFAGLIADVVVTGSPHDVVATVFGHGGFVLGTITVRLDGDVLWLESSYADGYSTIGLDPDTEDVVEAAATLTAEVIEERAIAVAEFLETQVAEGWLSCGVHSAMAVGVCAAGAASGGLALIGCPASAFKAGCECISAWAEKRGKRPCKL